MRRHFLSFSMGAVREEGRLPYMHTPHTDTHIHRHHTHTSHTPHTHRTHTTYTHTLHTHHISHTYTLHTHTTHHTHIHTHTTHTHRTHHTHPETYFPAFIFAKPVQVVRWEVGINTLTLLLQYVYLQNHFWRNNKKMEKES